MAGVSAVSGCAGSGPVDAGAGSVWSAELIDPVGCEW